MGTGNDDQWTAECGSRWSTYVTDWLRARRLTNAQAAEILGLSASTITQWRKHGDRPSLANAEAFGERIGGGAEEGRRMGGFAPIPEVDISGVTLEQVMRELRELKAMFEEVPNHPLLTRRREVATTTATPTRIKRVAPPL